MRELKFRVWSVDDKQFVKSIYHAHTECYIFIHAMFGNPVIFSQYGEEVELDETKYIIQQFTGCHDSTNKEIYEGDILANNHGNGTNIGYVGFTSGIFFLNYSDENNDELGYLLVSNIKIIGNIFEDPELIK